MRRFEVAKKYVNGVLQTKVNELTGIEEAVYWDVLESDMPEYATKHAAGADFRAVEDIVVKSIWKQIMKSSCMGTTRQLKSAFKDVFGDQFSESIGLGEIPNEDNERKLMEPTFIHTGIKACMEEDEVLYIYNRSSGPKKLGLVLANSVGVIDSDYYNNQGTDGEIVFAYYNFLPFDIKIKKGDKIGQGVFQKFLRADNAKVGGIREGGFGSTDNKKSVNLKKESDTVHKGIKIC